MRTVITPIAWLVLLFTVARAELNATFELRNRNFGRSLVQTSDGGFAVAAFTQDNDTEAAPIHAWLLRADSSGKMIWGSTVQGYDWDAFYSVALMGDAGFVATGSGRPRGAVNSTLIAHKFASDGTPSWTFRFDKGTALSASGYAIMQAQDQSARCSIVAGTICYDDVRQCDVLILKLNQTGGLVWNKTYGDSGDDVALGIAKTSGDSGFAVAGYRTLNQTRKMWVLRLDSKGGLIWERSFRNTEGSPVAYSIVQRSDQSFVAAGSTDYPSSGTRHVLVAAWSSAGTYLWNTTFGGTSRDESYSVVELPEENGSGKGRVAVTGYTYSYGNRFGLADAWIVAFNSSGQTEWVRMFGGAGVDEGHAIVNTADGGLAVAGFTDSFGLVPRSLWLFSMLCPHGTSVGETGCVPCVAGMYGTLRNAGKCRECEAGKYAPNPGATECLQCPIGTYTGFTKSASCTPCPSGSYGSAAGKTECTLCPSGTYNSNTKQTSCTKCPMNTYNPSSGGAFPTSCLHCGADLYSLEGATKCMSCGYAAGVNTSSVSKKPLFDVTDASNPKCYLGKCPAGYTSISDTFCVKCPKNCLVCKEKSGSAYCTSCDGGDYEVSRGKCVEMTAVWSVYVVRGMFCAWMIYLAYHLVQYWRNRGEKKSGVGKSEEKLIQDGEAKKEGKGTEMKEIAEAKKGN